MTNPQQDVQLPPEVAPYAQQIEQRLATVEEELKLMKEGMDRASASGISPAQQPWWLEIFGSFADNPLFDEAVRYGQEWRKSSE